MAEYINPQWQLPNNIGGVKDNNFSLDFTWPGSINSGYAIGSQKEYSFSIWFRWTKDGDPTANYSFIFGAASSGNGEDYRASLGLALVSSQVRFYITMGNGTGSGGYYWNSSQTVPTNLLNGEWHHFVLNVNETGQDLYIDNSLFYQYLYSVPGTGGASVGNPTTGAPGTSNYFIGNNGTAVPARNNLIAHAEMSNFAIFDYELNTGQIASLYGSAANGSGNPMGLASPPIAYYPLGNAASPNGLLLVPNAALQDYVYFFNGNSMFDAKITSGGGGDIFSNATNFSFSGWFNLGANYSYKSIFTIKDNTTNVTSFAINMYGNQLRFSVATSYNWIADLDDIVPYNTWFHYAGVFDGSGASDTDRLKLYINGQPKTVVYNTTVPTSFPTISSNSVFGLGGNAIGATWSGFTGYSTALQLWKSSLTPSEIITLYNNGSPLQTLANIPQNSDLELWYKLDASEVYNSTTTEWSIDNNQNPSAYSSSLKFVASELDRIDMPSDTILNPSSNYTFSIWFNPTSSNSNSTLVGSSVLSRGINMYYPPNNTKVTFYHKTSTANESFDIVFPNSPVNTWNNITITWSASTGIIRAFINGKYISQKENISDIVWGGTLRVGQYTSYAWYFDGQLSNLAMWDATLTDGFSGTPTTGDIAGGQVAEVYNNGTPQTTITGSPVGWWKLNNGGKFITDSSGNNFTATNHSGNFQTGGAIEHAGFVNTLAGDSSGMNQASLIQSDLLTTTSYSPYALQFDGLSDKIDCGISPFDETTGDITISAWVKRTAAAATYAPIVSATQGVGGANTQFSFQFYGNSLSLFWKGLGAPELETVPTSTFTVVNDVWYLINFVRTGTTGRFYVNGNFIHLSTKTYDDFISTGTPNLSIGAWWFSSNAGVTGSISNVALWNTSLSAVELREVYNEGRPSNLNNFSGTAPIHWWQLGSNSSFTSPDWTCLDEIGSSNGISSNMTEDRIVNGVGSSSNGVGFDSMGGGRKRTSTGFSQANGLSVNMTLANITGGVN